MKNIVPYVRFAMHHVWVEGYYIDRSIWDHEFIFIEQGSLKITIDGKTYIAKENDLVVLRPNHHHIIEYNGEPCHQPHVHFDFYQYEDKEAVGISMIRTDQMNEEDKTKFRPDFFESNEISIPDIIHLNEPRIVSSKLSEIIDEYTYHRPESQIVLQGLMTELIGLVLRENISKESNNNNTMLNTIISFMNENVDKNLTLEEISEASQISKWSLIRAFNVMYNTTPMKYYNKIRYLRAKDLILNSMSPISDIAFRMNFNEPQTFSRWFKNMDGNFPTYYRKY